MRYLLFFTTLFLTTFSCTETPKPMKYSSFTEYPVYEGKDLGFHYTANVSTFRLYSPEAEAVRIHLYSKDIGGEAAKIMDMPYAGNGIWQRIESRPLSGYYYTYQIQKDGEWLVEAPDPYSKACGANGLRTHIIDMAITDPDNWEADKRPFSGHPTEMVIYEIHVRDMSIHPNSGITNKGKYLGLTESGTKTPSGISTGIDYLKNLGVTHVHILPSFDFRTIDETLPEDKRNYNWGYDPHLYNVPEGSYATNPHDGAVRIKEYKQMVKALHDAGIGVILDVVYNHTGTTEGSVFERVAPGYYYRQREDGTYSDASACGNETASERPMVRDFIVNSVKYWAEEYHLDGFRFDLMAIHDIETMNEVSKTLKAIDPNIFVYGEGWTAGSSPLPDERKALKANAKQLTDVAVFSDEVRDGLKGHVFTANAKGFISGEPNLEASVQFGIVGGIEHPQLDYKKVNYTDKSWSNQPAQCMVYASCHDNHTIWDRLNNSIPEASDGQKAQMSALALGAVLTSQGVPFLHAGSEFCRTKQGEENSYKSPDEINWMDYDRAGAFSDNVQFVKDLIALRKAHPIFRLEDTAKIQNQLSFAEFKESNIIAYEIDGKDSGDQWKRVYVALNGSSKEIKVKPSAGTWKAVFPNMKVQALQSVQKNQYLATVPANSMVILYEEEE